MFPIGTVECPNRVIAAPMAGVTDKAYRILAREFGCGLPVTEMVNDKGLIYGQGRTAQMADVRDEAAPVGVQIFGSQPETMARAAQVVEGLGAAIVDINMGCPTPKIVKNGEGAALMLDLARSRAIIRAVVGAVQVPVTVKMRRGWEDGDWTCLELAGIAEQEGAQAVTIHARSRNQFYSGSADWPVIKAVRQRVDIAVIGNGDISSAEDARRMLEETGCDAVMIGRAALGNPFIFRQTAALVEEGRTIAPPSVEEILTVAARHLQLVCQFKGEDVGVREMRKHFSWYTRGIRGAARIREEINRATTQPALLETLQQIRRA